MKEAAQLAGFLAADAVLRVATGKTLAPLIIFEKADGTSQIILVEEATPQEAAAKGEKLLRTNAGGAERGVMAFDAYLNLPQGRSDAIFLQAWQYGPLAQGDPAGRAVPPRKRSAAGLRSVAPRYLWSKTSHSPRRNSSPPSFAVWTATKRAASFGTNTTMQATNRSFSPVRRRRSI